MDLPPLHKLVSEVLYERGILSVKFKSLAGRVVYFRPFIQRKTSTGSRLVERVLFVVGSTGELVIADVDANPKRAVSLARVTSVLVDGSTLTLLFESGSAEHDVQVKFASPPPGIDDSTSASAYKASRVTFADDAKEALGQQQHQTTTTTSASAAAVAVPLQTLRQFLHVLKHYSPNVQIIHGSSSAIDIRLGKPSHFEEPKVDIPPLSPTAAQSSGSAPLAALATTAPSSLPPSPPPPIRTSTKVMSEPATALPAPTQPHSDDNIVDDSQQEGMPPTFRQLTQRRQNAPHTGGHREGYDDGLESDLSPKTASNTHQNTVSVAQSAQDDSSTDPHQTNLDRAERAATLVEAVEEHDASGVESGETAMSSNTHHHRRAPRAASLDRLARLSERSEQLSAKLTAAPPAELLAPDASLAAEQPLLSDMVRKLRAKRAEVQMHNMMLEGEIRGLRQRTQRLLDSHQHENPMPEFDFAPVHAAASATRGRTAVSASPRYGADVGTRGERIDEEESRQGGDHLDSLPPVVMTATRQYYRTINMALLILSICRRQRQIHLHAERDAREQQRAAERRYRGNFGTSIFADSALLSRIHGHGGGPGADPSADMRSLLSMSFVH